MTKPYAAPGAILPPQPTRQPKPLHTIGVLESISSGSDPNLDRSSNRPCSTGAGAVGAAPVVLELLRQLVVARAEGKALTLDETVTRLASPLHPY